MLDLIVASAMLVAGGFNGELEQYSHLETCEFLKVGYLSDSERDQIVREWQFAIQKMARSLSEAERYAGMITHVDTKRLMERAISAGVASLVGKSFVYSVVTTLANVVGGIAGDSYSYYAESKQYVKDAAYYAYHADELQYKLIRG